MQDQLKSDDFQFGIIGLGLIGGSIAKSLSANKFEVFAEDSNKSYYDEAIKDKALVGSLDEINNVIGSKSIFFLSLEGTYKAMGYEKRDNETPQFTDHCFTGDYPTSLLDREQGTVSKQFSLLSEKN